MRETHFKLPNNHALRQTLLRMGAEQQKLCDLIC